MEKIFNIFVLYGCLAVIASVVGSAMPYFIIYNAVLCFIIVVHLFSRVRLLIHVSLLHIFVSVTIHALLNSNDNIEFGLTVMLGPFVIAVIYIIFYAIVIVFMLFVYLYYKRLLEKRLRENRDLILPQKLVPMSQGDPKRKDA